MKKRYSVRQTEEINADFKQLIPIDQKKIRKKYISNCKRTIRELEKAKSDWNDYHSKDVPDFEKWYFSSFREQLSELRFMEEKSRDLHSILYEIEYLKNKKRINVHKAYQIVMDRRNHPEKYPPPEEEYRHSSSYQDDESDSEFQEEDLKEMFEFFLKINPDIEKESKREGMYEYLFSRFKEEFFKSEKKNHSYQMNEEEPEKIEPNVRVKQIFRELARKLHPDFQKEQNEFIKDLWNEVQVAYENNDLEKLETLLALSNIHVGDFSDDISVSQLLNVKIEFKNQLKAIRNQLRKAKKTREWGFSKLKNKTIIFKSVHREISFKIRQYELDIFEIEKFLMSLKYLRI
ncbi:MAG: hypothetical protein H7A24_10090 [Leptospiraceae bacterium]|nr:hypothetical protein [Leptospiraceae bacterium]MCP5512220.1 hypothetical protein [Leptospiraceae bacterium]